MVDPAVLERLLDKAAEPTLATIRREKLDAPPDIRRMLEYLEGNLFEPSLNVNTWREAIGLRDNSIAIRFRSFTGLTPKSYINRRRHETAARLLCETRLKIWQIGELVGFASLGVFSKSFARTMGQRPRAYRETHREPGESTDRAAHLFEPAEVEAALAGTLDQRRASELVEAILRHYPGLSATFWPTGDP